MNENLNQENVVVDDEKLKEVLGAGFVHIEEPTPGDPRCNVCHSHLDYQSTSGEGYHVFRCSGCGKQFQKYFCGTWRDD